MMDKHDEQQLEGSEGDHSESQYKEGISMNTKEEMLLNRLKLMCRPGETDLKTIINRAKEEYAIFEKWENSNEPIGHIQVLVKGRKYICLQQFNPSDILGSVSFFVDYPEDYVLEFWRHGDNETDKTPLFKCRAGAIGTRIKEFRNGRKLWVNISRASNGKSLVCVGFDGLEKSLAVELATKTLEPESLAAKAAGALRGAFELMRHSPLKYASIILLVGLVLVGFSYAYGLFTKQTLSIVNNPKAINNVNDIDKNGAFSASQSEKSQTMQSENLEKPISPTPKAQNNRRQQKPLSKSVRQEAHQNTVVSVNDGAVKSGEEQIVTRFRLSVNATSEPVAVKLHNLGDLVAERLRGFGYEVTSGDGPMLPNEAKITLTYKELPDCDGGLVIAFIENTGGNPFDVGYSCPFRLEINVTNASEFLSETIKQRVTETRPVVFN